ncbi:MAG: hypothetical protein ACM31D_12955 [Bacteroidota bacterium]
MDHQEAERFLIDQVMLGNEAGSNHASDPLCGVGAHVNTDHAHLHVALNRVHPEIYRCAEAPPGMVAAAVKSAISSPGSSTRQDSL